MKTPVAVTGMGMISAAGMGVAPFQEALANGHSFFSTSHAYPELDFPVVGAFIHDFDFANTLSNFSILTPEQCKSILKLTRNIPHNVQLAIIAAAEALQAAGFNEGSHDSNKTGLIIGAQNATTHYQYDLFPEFEQTPFALSPSYALHFMDSDYIGILSEIFSIHGEGFTIGASSATGNVALLKGCQLIQDHRLDACVVVGAVADLSPMELQGFYTLGALGGANFAESPQKACRPFDQAHNGFIYGQASACLLLENLASAEKRGAKILAKMMGGSMNLDGNRTSSPSLEGEMRVMREALKNAGLSPKDINYINAHGTSTPLGDEVEANAIATVFSESLANIRINSTKSIIGHCLWSAGIVEAIATIIQMQHGWVHASLNLETPVNPTLTFVKHKKSWPIHYALSNGFAMGGINTALIFAPPR